MAFYSILSFIPPSIPSSIGHIAGRRSSLASVHPSRFIYSSPRSPIFAFPIVRASTSSTEKPMNAGIDAIVSAGRFQNSFTDHASESAVPVDFVKVGEWSQYIDKQNEKTRTWLLSFPSPPQTAIPVPSTSSSLAYFAVPLKNSQNPLWRSAAALSHLPPGHTYSIRTPSDLQPSTIEISWGLLSYSFSLFKKSDIEKSPILVRLTTPKSADRADVDRALTATFMVRDMISVPTENFGPPELEAAVSTLAAQNDASSSSIVADQLITLGYPQVHCVGRAAAADRSPRLLELLWGPESAPCVVLVGKGVCYDTGGLSIKPTASMVTMKKDMGGAAQVLGLASMVMNAGLPVRLRVLIPAVENAIAGNSFRPGDVLTARNGLTTLNMNSDAEGRLILADALVAAAEENPDIIIDCATLTGAQRVAMGPEIPSFFCTDETVSTKLFETSKKVNDLVWPMPLYEPYRKMLDTPLADIKSCSSGGHGGAITAALYLKEFVGDSLWIHVDFMGYNTSSSAGRPEGGEAMGMRALFEMLRDRYSQ